MPVDARQKYAQILENYQSTLSVKRTSELLGYPMQTVRRAVKQAGLQPSGAKDGACYDNIENIRQWINDGLNLQQMAERIGTTRHAVRRFLTKNSIPYQNHDRKGERNGNSWKGGRMIDKDGYVMIKNHDHPYRNRHNYVREHRLVMEQVLGRHLEPSEVVHHKDGNKQNNHPDNLELYSSNKQHLAETLAGQTPKWTPAGYAAMCAPKPRKPKSTQTE